MEFVVTATMERLEAMPYPATYMPEVAGAAGRREVLLVETGGGPEGIAVRPFLLCQDWDHRVVVHWEDDRQSYTYTVTNVIADTPERFEFLRGGDGAARMWLTPLTYEQFERDYRARFPETGGIPRFESQEQFRRHFVGG